MVLFKHISSMRMTMRALSTISTYQFAQRSRIIRYCVSTFAVGGLTLHYFTKDKMSAATTTRSSIDVSKFMASPVTSVDKLESVS
jgi:hypothetical protein